MKLYSDDGFPTEQGLDILAQILGGKVWSYDRFSILLPGTLDERIAALEWDEESACWELLSLRKGDHAIEHVEMLNIALGSLVYEQLLTDRVGAFLPGETADMCEALWVVARDKWLNIAKPLYMKLYDSRGPSPEGFHVIAKAVGGEVIGSARFQVIKLPEVWQAREVYLAFADGVWYLDYVELEDAEEHARALAIVQGSYYRENKEKGSWLSKSELERIQDCVDSWENALQKVTKNPAEGSDD